MKRRKKMFESLKKPEICDSLESVQFSMFQEDENMKKENKYKDMLDEIINTSKEKSQNERDNMKFNLIDQFVENFVSDMMRGPNKQEMMNNLNFDELGITEQDIEDFMRDNAHKFVVKTTTIP